MQIAGIPDAGLRNQLCELFQALHLARTAQVPPRMPHQPGKHACEHAFKTASKLGAWLQGIYTKRSGASPSLALLGPVIDEMHAEPSLANGAGPSSAPIAPVVEQAAADGLRAASEGGIPPHNSQQEAEQQGEEAATTEGHAEEMQQDAAPSAGAAQIGPQMGPQVADGEPDLAALQEAAEALEEGPAGELLGTEPVERQGDASEAGSRRVVAGPAMPSAELLAAAAEAKEAVRCTQNATCLNPGLALHTKAVELVRMPC